MGECFNKQRCNTTDNAECTDDVTDWMQMRRMLQCTAGNWLVPVILADSNG